MPSILNNQHILLDTCFLIKAKEYSDTTYFDKLFLVLEENNCIPVVNEFIKFEFLRGCQKQSHITDKTNFLDSLSGVSLPTTQDILNTAIDIANIYQNKNIPNSKISIVDCYISAYLQKYNQSLILLTLNNDDFPLILHDRVEIVTIDTQKDILVLGFYKFNINKFTTALNHLASTS